MAKTQQSQPLASSVLDRLIANLQSPSASSRQRSQVLSDLKKSVSRDLHNLLNTRTRCEKLPGECEGLEDSLANYGLPEFAQADPADFQQSVKEVILRYEPRLKNVKVSLVKNSDPADRTLRFRIDASLYVEPALEPLVFESRRDPVTGTIEVKAEG